MQQRPWCFGNSLICNQERSQCRQCWAANLCADKIRQDRASSGISVPVQGSSPVYNVPVYSQPPPPMPPQYYQQPQYHGYQPANYQYQAPPPPFQQGSRQGWQDPLYYTSVPPTPPFNPPPNQPFWSPALQWLGIQLLAGALWGGFLLVRQWIANRNIVKTAP